ncbi:Periplasmic protein [Salmonella enterica subsp. diarizonae]|uniref:Periplasmic chaperone Spy n=4 Tax=Salmonella enterica TaxID=28901 RepID=A0A379TYH0_SALDZ|nr:Periplasmic protein [Salmonella enterica subsp. diarizonae]
MRKLTALFVASTLAMGAANLAHAAETTTAAPADAKPMMQHKGKFGPHHDMMFKNLNLTDAQKQQIRDIMKAQREQMKRPPLEERRAMHDIIASDTFDKAKAEAQITKMEAQRKANMLAHMETQNKIYNVLTPEQKKQYNANFEKRLTERPAQEGKMPAAQNNFPHNLRPPVLSTTQSLRWTGSAVFFMTGDSRCSVQ